MSKIPKIPNSVLSTVLALILTFSAAQTLEQLVDPPEGEWPQLGRDVTRSHFSPLDQIDTSNVNELRLAWARDLDFRPGGRPIHMQGAPSVWEGVMYVSTDTGLIALDAATGQEIWTYDRPSEEEPHATDTARSAFLNVAPRGAPVVFDGKVFINQRNGDTVAVDAESGEELWRTAVGNPELNMGFTTNPIFANGKLIVGPNGADYGGAPGKIVSLNVEDGEILWTFDVVPLSPDHPVADTWTNLPSWEDGIGGASAWNSGAYDPETNTVVYGTGQPTPWDRLDWRRRNEGELTIELYTASFVALDADTGELKWYHQVVPADEWDYDQLTVPIFADVEIEGQSRRVALLATTTGYVVVIDAETGEFLQGHQIHPDPTVHIGYEDDGTAIINNDNRHLTEGDFKRICPGLRWAGHAPGAFSPETGLLYRSNDNNCMNYAAASIPDDWEPGQTALAIETGPKNEDYWFEGREGALSAIDPATGEVVWEWTTYYPHNTGVVATAGDLVFFGATDSRVRALNATSGEVLWEHPVTAGTQGGTITYAVDGKQYVATLIGLSSGIQATHPDADLPPAVAGNAAVFVFSLP
jgi:PQQ-dependent dehydrogenase (methanol/ethanol family)